VDPNFSDYLTTNSIDENIVLKGLMASPKFKQLFTTGIRSKNITIFWIDNNKLNESDPFPKLPVGVLAAGKKLRAKTWVVIVRNVPAEHKEETTIAHELAHIILDNEGYPLTDVTSDFVYREELTCFLASLNNMIHDPLVIMKLKSHGYDLRREYIQECQEGLKILQNTYVEPSGIKEAQFIFDYVKDILENKILFDDKNTACKKFLDVFGQRFGSVKTKSEILHKIISEIGIDSPDKVRTIYEMIIEKFGLSKMVYLD
jgi:hypothetical protein